MATDHVTTPNTLKGNALRLAGYIVLALVTGGLMAGLHADGQFIRTDWLVLLVWLVPCALVARRCEVSGVGCQEEAGESTDQGLLATGGLRPAFFLLFALFLYLFSSGASTTFSYFIDWMPEGTHAGNLFDARITWFVFLTGLLAVVFSMRAFRMDRMAMALLLIGQVLCAYQLLEFTQGQNIYNDDHTSFTFRLWELASTFPQYRNYNPYWNGGVGETHIFASGISLVGTPFIPFVKAFGAEAVYTYMLLIVYIIILPWIAVGSLRIMQADKTASYIAGALMLGATLKFFLWMLHYGTIAANFAMPFILPVSACLYRIIFLEKREWWVGALLVLSSVCMLMWPLAGMAAIAFVPILVLHAKRVLKPKTIGFLLLCLVFLVLLYAKNTYMILFESSTFEKNFVGVVADEESHKTFVFSWAIVQEGWKLITDHLREANPLVLFLGFLGAFAYPDRTIRTWFGGALLVIFIIAAWGPSYFEDLQLRRMSIPMVALAVIPCALWAARILQTSSRRVAIARGMVAALLMLSVWNCSRIYANEGYMPYRTMQPYMQELIDWIEENVPEGSRVLFGGRTVHKFGRAHVAALPMITGREMMACDYYSFSPEAVEYEYPPRPFRVEEDGNYRFMQLYNVSHLITYHNNYIRHFKERPHQYELVFVNEEKNIHVFRVLQELSPFLLGEGTVEAAFNNIRVNLSEPADEVVIKYNWHERLSVDPPAEIYPYQAHEHATLIGIRPNGSQDIQIRYKSLL